MKQRMGLGLSEGTREAAFYRMGMTLSAFLNRP